MSTSTALPRYSLVNLRSRSTKNSPSLIRWKMGEASRAAQSSRQWKAADTRFRVPSRGALSRNTDLSEVTVFIISATKHHSITTWR